MIIDGKQISKDIKDEIKSSVNRLRVQDKYIHLAVVQVGHNPASTTYVKNKKNACIYTGIQYTDYNLDETTTEYELINIIRCLNDNDDINGILVQLPLPSHINEERILSVILPEKDVDCFHPVNVGNLVIGKGKFLPCTPAGIIELLHRSNIEIEGKECVIIGRSNIVGKPMATLMLQENATVTICHSKTKNLKEITKRADILIVAIGKPEFITADYVKPGATVIDVGIHRLSDNKLCGDVKFDEVEKIAGAITPVPGGVGPMTIAMLMKNCLNSLKEK